MNRVERAFVFWAIAYTVVYFFVFIGCAITLSADQLRWLFPFVLPFHFLGMVQNGVAYVLTVRDLYRRPFPDPNSKLTWLLLIHWTGGICWFVYVFRHAIKPRPVLAGG